MEEMKIYSELKNAQMLIEAKEYDKAESLLTDIITVLEHKEVNTERNAHLSEAYNNMGLILYKKVEFNRAQSFYSKSIQMNPSFAPAYYNKGLIHYRLGLFESAVKDIQRSVQLEPENSEFEAGLQASKLGLNETRESVT